jgi:hypothetical protein
MKYAAHRPLADPEKAARKLLEIAGASTSRRSTGRSCSRKAAARPNTAPGLSSRIAKGWLWRHESGTYVKFTPTGAELFA